MRVKLSLIIIFLVIGCNNTSPVPATPVDFPDTSNPIMQNVTIEYWKAGHKAMVIRTPQLEIKK